MLNCLQFCPAILNSLFFFKFKPFIVLVVLTLPACVKSLVLCLKVAGFNCCCVGKHAIIQAEYPKSSTFEISGIGIKKDLNPGTYRDQNRDSNPDYELAPLRTQAHRITR